MNSVRLGALLWILCFVFIGPIFAQDEHNDKGYIAQLIEDSLSTDDTQVRLTGFEGALSSLATLKELTIADRDGIWLTIKDAQLSWSRSALLSGHVDIERLVAQDIILSRLPKGEDKPTQFEAKPFEFPELPVAVTLGKLEAARIHLGKDVLGQPLSLRLGGHMNLGNGDVFDVAFQAQRLGEKQGAFEVSFLYNAQSKELKTILDVSEQEGGLLSEILDLPGHPSVAFKFNGLGPLSDFNASLSLRTDQVVRLRGALQSQKVYEDTQGLDRKTSLKLNGDISALFLPAYRDFLGTKLQSTVLLDHFHDGRLDVSEWSVNGKSLAFDGQGKVAADGRLVELNFKGDVAPSKGGAVLLPLSGLKTYVDHIELSAQYNRSISKRWSADVAVKNLKREDLSVQDVRLNGLGTLEHEAFTGRMSYMASGLEFLDQGLTQALGRDVRGEVEVEHDTGRPIKLPVLRLKAKDTVFEGSSVVDLEKDTPHISAILQLTSQKLSSFSKLAGRPLKGAGQVALDVNIFPKDGSFDLSLLGEANNVAVGVLELDRLLLGASTFSLKVVRDDQGVRLSGGDLVTPHLKLKSSGELSAKTQELNLEGTVFDLSRIASEMRGPLRINAQIDQRTLEAQLVAPKMKSDLSARGLWEGAASQIDTKVTGNIALDALNPILAPQRMSGTATLNLQVVGDLQSPNVRGTIETNGTVLSVPEAAISLDDISGVVRFLGRSAQVNLKGVNRSGGQFQISGPMSLNADPAVELKVVLEDISLKDPKLYDTAISGEIDVVGPLASLSNISGRLSLAPTELQVPSSTVGLLGELPPITHLNANDVVRQTLKRAGLSVRPKLRPKEKKRASTSIPIDIKIDAPSRIFIRGRGIDAELGGILHLKGTSQRIIPSGQFSLIRGRLDILSQRLTLTQAHASLEGDFEPTLTLAAQTQSPNGTVIRVLVEGAASQPKITFSSVPDLPQDEVLALLIFGRSLSDISPLQALQLANAVAVLAGSEGGGVIESLRANIGIDDLDIRTDDEGNTAVRAGAYVSENVYTNVELDSSGNTELNINLELTDDVTSKGRLKSDGEASLGLFFERDY